MCLSIIFCELIKKLDQPAGTTGDADVRHRPMPLECLTGTRASGTGRHHRVPPRTSFFFPLLTSNPAVALTSEPIEERSGSQLAAGDVAVITCKNRVEF